MKVSEDLSDDHRGNVTFTLDDNGQLAVVKIPDAFVKRVVRKCMNILRSRLSCSSTE